ncbi:MAG TPA: P1 family peptidase [Chloroflexota bacterium]|nr:P1 family peptidase [Chloroflexota bacterium]
MGTGLTSVPGLRVGHWTNLDAATGCTVVLCEQGPRAGVDVRGAAPATRETDVLRPGSLVGRAHAILLSGGSAFGLDAATGVMRYLEERGVGFPTPAGPVPIVPAAALFDLGIGRPDVRPDAEAGYAACRAAADDLTEGTVGAGTGATVAKLGGPGGAIKSGTGTAARRLPDGTIVGVLLAVNAVGAVYDPWSGAPLALPRSTDSDRRPLVGTSTTIGVIATTAALDAGGVSRIATIGHDGLALAIRPAHTSFDGDTLFALSVPSDDPEPAAPDILALEQAVVEVVAEAVLRAIRAATALHGVPAASG